MILQANTKINQVKTLLRFTYGLVPIVAGADKFTNLLTHWPKYLNPSLKLLMPFNDHVFMMVIGLIEIIAGVTVLAKPKVGAFIVSAWLAIIALTLIFSNSFLDVAVRDLVMAIGAYSLGILSIEDR